MNISGPFITRPIATTLLTAAILLAGGVAFLLESVKNLGRYAASWNAWWPKRPSSTAALT